MLISYQWIRELLDSASIPSVADVASRLTAGGLEVEAITEVGQHLAAIRIATVLSTRLHPTSKNPLTLVTIDAGQGPLEVVCGASNVPAPGGFVCFAPLGATVLDKNGTPFVLQSKAIAGIASTGMLCAEDELGLGDDHAGIIVLESGTTGRSLTEMFPSLHDYVLEVNVTPNRPDALGHLGVAREVAALCALPFAPTRHETSHLPVSPSQLSLSVDLQARDRCPRYSAIALSGLTVKRSPLEGRVRLKRLGVRAINNVVDVTNLVMLELGQPLHVFDHARIGGSTLVIRQALPGESLKTLDGKTMTLSEDDLVIADTHHAMALAGIMGGEDSGVSAQTTAVVIESAFFAPKHIRRSAKRVGLHTESSHRFERGTDRVGTRNCLNRAANLLAQWAGGSIASSVIDEQPVPMVPLMVALRAARYSDLTGRDLRVETLAEILGRVGCETTVTSDAVQAIIPSHRPDISAEIDLVEEVARIDGYDKIPSSLPHTSGARAGTTRDFWSRRSAREAFSSVGLTEAFSLALCSAEDLTRTQLSELPRVKVTNPIAEKTSFVRPSLLPALFAACSHAHTHGVTKVRLFEVGTVFSPEGERESGLAHEHTDVAGILAGPRDAYLATPEATDFFDAKGVIAAALQRMTHHVVELATCATPPPWAHPRACASVRLGNTDVGVLAEVHPDVRDAWSLRGTVTVFELHLRGITEARKIPHVTVPGRFPTMQRDVALLVARKHQTAALARTLRTAAGGLCVAVELFDRFLGEQLPEGTHSLGFTLAFRSDERTLKDEEVDEATARAVQSAVQEFGAQQR